MIVYSGQLNPIYCSCGIDLADTAPNFFLIAHSHGVSLLDGITDWRSVLRKDVDPDPRYGQAFQGWFQGAIPRIPFKASLTGHAPSLGQIEIWIMSDSEGVLPLVGLPQPGAEGSPQIPVNPEYLKVLQSWRGATPIISMINGNEHALTMLKRWPPFDFLEGEIPLESEVPVIDDVFIDEHVEPWLDSVFLPLELLKHVSPNPVAHVLPPPPRENPQNSTHLEVLREAISRYGYTPDRLRLKWYRRYCRLLSTRLAAIGCDVLSPSPEACNSEGLLREDYAEGLTHGNSRYGVLTARQIESWLHGLRA